MSGPVDPVTGRAKLGGRAQRPVDLTGGCTHRFEPVGMWGPYPLEGCIWCTTGAICPVPGNPPPFETLIAALDAGGCEPRMVDDEDGEP